MTRVGYLTGTYPRPTDTFIQREIAAHRSAGWEVHTFAVRPPDPEALTSAAQRGEHAGTSYLLGDRQALLADAVRAFARWPGRVPATVRLAWRTRRRGVPGGVRQVAYLVEAAALASRLAAADVDHLHNHLGDSSCTVAMLSAELGDHTFSFTLHGSSVFFEAVSWQLGEKVRRAAFCACISHFTRAQAAVFAPERLDAIEVVRCGVHPNAYDLRTHSGSGHVVVSVSRLEVAKGYTVLLDAVAALVRGGGDVRVVLIGDGPDRRHLAQRAAELGLADRVEFTGYLSPDDVAKVLSSADVFVLPSFAEGVPVSLMEAMACGLPVVATQVGGVAELVEDGVSGVLVAPGDATVLTARLGELLGDGARREAMGRAGRAKVERDHDSSREAGRLRELIARARSAQA